VAAASERSVDVLTAVSWPEEIDSFGQEDRHVPFG
jgi:hypothetical protein